MVTVVNFIRDYNIVYTKLLGIIVYVLIVLVIIKELQIVIMDDCLIEDITIIKNGRKNKKQKC